MKQEFGIEMDEEFRDSSLDNLILRTTIFHHNSTFNRKTTCVGPGCIHILIAWERKLHHGSWRGVGSLSLGPIVTSAVPISRGPRGAQYCPVFEISKVSVHLINDFAASSGVTAWKSLAAVTSKKMSKTYLRLHPSTCRIQHPWSSLFA